MLRLDLELKDHEGSTALWLALQYITVTSDPSVNPFEDEAPVANGTSFDENSYAARLIQRGSNPDAPDSNGTAHLALYKMSICVLLVITPFKPINHDILSSGNCLMQRAAIAGSEAATIFLATHGAKVNHTNKWVSLYALIINPLSVTCLNIHTRLQNLEYININLSEVWLSECFLSFLGEGAQEWINNFFSKDA